MAQNKINNFHSGNYHNQITHSHNPTYEGPSQLPSIVGCISVADGYVETELGISLKLDSPPLPLAILCGSKNKPSNVNISVSIVGRFTQIITSMTLSVTIGENHFHNSVTTKNSEQKTMSLNLSLNKGNDLRPLSFKVEFSCINSTGTVYKKLIKNTYCIMMTAPCTQRRKAFSLLAWQENSYFIKNLKITVKGSKLSQDVIPVRIVKESLIGRWKHLFPSRVFPEGFNHLLDNLTSSGFFKDVLEKRGKDEQFLVSLLQQEFSTIWMWYEAAFTFISENPELFFDNYLIHISTREQCEKNLLDANLNYNLFTIRFGSKEDSLVLSCRTAGDSITHVLLNTKEFPQQLIEKVLVLEGEGFKFHCGNGEIRNSIADILQSYSKSKQKKQEPSNYVIKDFEFFKMIQKSDQPNQQDSDFHLFPQSQNQPHEPVDNSFGLFAGKYTNEISTSLQFQNQINTEDNLLSSMQVHVNDSEFHVPPEFENLLSKRPFSSFENSQNNNNNNNTEIQIKSEPPFNRLFNQNNNAENFTFQNNDNDHNHNHNHNHDNSANNNTNPTANNNASNFYSFADSMNKRVKLEQDDFETLLKNAELEESDISIPIFDTWKSQSFSSDDFVSKHQ